ncbi:MAG TPA: HAD-IC family P-type ATPase, partial [Planctomycetaceae bacterium]|nr:HAD-IC family P-type ATPase [Planctomycetaceae bacterium]
TLTENRMTVTALDVAGNRIDLPETMSHGRPMGKLNSDSGIVEVRGTVARSSSLSLLLAGAALCNDAELVFESNREIIRAIGDPTEGALVLAAAQLHLPIDKLLSVLPRVDELPFDSDRKRMTTVHEWNAADRDDLEPTLHSALENIRSLSSHRIAFTKGAVDSLLLVSDHVWNSDQRQPMDEDWRARIAQANEELAGMGMRVLGVAFRPLPDAGENLHINSVEEGLTFIGLLAMIDPARPEVEEAVQRCRQAGIRPIMITGDHPLTAQYIAGELGISQDGQVLSGQDLEDMPDSELRSVVNSVSVFARVAPKHKLRLVKALQKNGEVVAMTGDGVNDAPALKQAHIGIAMGITGTDVAKESSQMVLLDDNFATIVNAIEEGRKVYDNVRKFVKYTMTSNAGEIWVMILGPLLGMPLPLLPLQILWVNLVTDGLPGLALAVEKSERGTMTRPPHPPAEAILGRRMGIDIAWIGLLMGVVSLLMGYLEWSAGDSSEAHWRTVIFTVLTLSQMGNALAIRSEHESLFQLGIFSNPAMLASIALTFGLQLAVIYWPPLQSIFKTAPLSGIELLSCLALSTLVFWAVEVQKFVVQVRGRAKQSRKSD